MLWFRHADRRFPFLWESDGQPPARWHGAGEGPTQYMASTPDGAWAEFLRHEEIRDPAELAGIERAVWAVELPEGSEHPAQPALPEATLRGGLDSYPACRAEARRLRADGATAVEAPSAALFPGTAGGQRVEAGLIEADAVGGRVLAVFGQRPQLRGWLCAQSGRPAERVLGRVRHL